MPLVQGIDARGRPIFAPSPNSAPGAVPVVTGGAGVTGDKLMQAVDVVDPAPNKVEKYNSQTDYSPYENRTNSIVGQGQFATGQVQQQAANDVQKRLAARQAAASKSVDALANKYNSKKYNTGATILRDTNPRGSSGGGMSIEGTATTLRARLVAKVATQKGVDYQWGGESPRTGFDCSGLVQWAYGKLGVRMPRTSGPQAKMGTRAPISKLRPGDLVAHPGHIAVYAGNGMMWEAPHTGAQVRLVKVRRDMYGVRLHLPGD